jgi:hypothetical protein
MLRTPGAVTETNSLLKRWLINRLGIAVLLFGLVSAGAVYWSGNSGSVEKPHDQETVASGSHDDTLSFEDSKTSSRGIEMYFGKVGVLIATWFRRWAELKDSERLAVMIATSSVLAALICFFVANRLPGK